MSRIIKDDLGELLKYIEQFSLHNLAGDKDYTKFISTCHKKYYGFFVASVEFEGCLSANHYKYLKESNSDLATTFFHLMSGSYKSARLLLRSSIECFLKAFTLDWIPDIDREKSVYEVFNQIKALPYFSTSPQKEQFTNVHNTYKELCKDVHVADQLNMAQIDALDLLPKYDKKEAEKVQKLFLNLIPSYLFLISDKFNTRFHKIHHHNRDIILLSIKRELRPFIMKIKD